MVHSALTNERERETARLAALDYLDAVRSEADQVLQELVDEVRSIFGTELGMVNLILSGTQYFRAWSGGLPANLIELRQDLRENSMCPHVVATEMPLVVRDFLATEEFKDQHYCVEYGFRFYAGTPLITSDGHAIGTLCLLDTQPRELGEEQMKVLAVFARAVVGRLELLGALRREQSANQEQARRSHELQRTLDASLDMVATIGIDGVFKSMSLASRTILGYEPEELVGRRFVDLVYPDDRELSAEATIATSDGASTKRFENRCRRKDGSVAWIEWNTQYLSEEAMVYCVARDITERKQAEAAQRKSEELIRRLLDNFPNGSVNLFDRDLRYIFAGGKGLEQVGLSSELLVGKTLAEVFPKESVDFVAPYYRRAFAGEDVEFELALGEQTYSINAAPLREQDDEVHTIIAVALNITERKQAEKERDEILGLEQAARTEAEAVQARLETILNNLTEGVLVANLQGQLLFANTAARAMVCTASEEFPQELPNPWADFHLPEVVSNCATSKQSIEAQVRYGDTFLRVKLECLVGGLEDQGDVLVVIQDLSEGHRLEANQQRFLANAAHQLRTPTMAIMGAAELLATGEDANPATRGRLLKHIFSEGRRMQRLSDALLRLSRVGWDLREPSLEVVDLRAAGQQAAAVMEPLAESAGLRLSIEGEGASWVRADPELLQEVLLVLLSNAIKHSSRGGDIRLWARAGAIIVEDEGAGVSSVDLPHIFERFYRGRGHSEGFGLGLSICRELTERMGGSISVSSREGVGTAIELELPEVDLGSKDTER
jgi:PAS domain S-box-containing protein